MVSLAAQGYEYLIAVSTESHDLSLAAMATIYQYVAEPGSGLQCVICLDVAEDPWQHGQCGRLLCCQCLRRYGEDKP